MSFNGLKTPVLGDIDLRKRRFVVPIVHGKNGALTCKLTPEQEEAFRKYFPIRFNRDIMEMFGLSFTTVHRLAREMGLKKNMKVIQHKHAMHNKKVCEQNGYYDSIRGKQVSEACKEGMRRKWAEGFHPLKQIKEANPRRYKALMKKRSEDRKEVIRKAKRRLEIGLPPGTNLHIPVYDYSRTQTLQRHYAKKQGYIVGSKRENSGERYIIYYTKDTIRGERFEKNLEKNGFTVKEYAVRHQSNGYRFA